MNPATANPPRVLICHERFLFRFGADRVFMLIASQLRSAGCHVTMMAARYDREPVMACADCIVTIPMPSAYQRSDEFCSRWFRETFAPKARAGGGYDLIIQGGWPLFSAAAEMRSLAPRVLFLDHGVVPTAGYPRATSEVLDLLRELRQRHLSACTHAAGVSRFVVESQTVRDVGPSVPVRVLLNGADHLAATPALPATGEAVARVQNLAARGHPLVLNLGRFETGTYKNSQAALAVFRHIRSAIPAARLLVLETAENLRLTETDPGVELIGFPDDAALSAIIGLVSLGLSTSLWEGYNLPLVELLRNGTPALAFRIGAHPEVVPSPAFLCRDQAEMSARAVAILEDSQPARALLADSSAAAHWRHLTWERFTRELVAFVDLPVKPAVQP